MDGYSSDEEQWTRVKEWWRANGTFIIAGLVIGVAIIGGWRYWKYYQAQRSLAASAIYVKFEGALGARTDKQKGAAEAVGRNLIENYADTPYAAQAALGLASVEISAAKLHPAAKHLKWVVDNGADSSLKLLARLRLARVQIAAHKPKDALTTLAGGQAGGFASLYAEAEGDAYQALGNSARARQAYQRALAAHTDKMGDDHLLKMKLRATAPAADKS